jgi:hypothetical protein
LARDAQGYVKSIVAIGKFADLVDEDTTETGRNSLKHVDAEAK